MEKMDPLVNASLYTMAICLNFGRIVFAPFLKHVVFCINAEARINVSLCSYLKLIIDTTSDLSFDSFETYMRAEKGTISLGKICMTSKSLKGY